MEHCILTAPKINSTVKRLAQLSDGFRLSELSHHPTARRRLAGLGYNPWTRSISRCAEIGPMGLDPIAGLPTMDDPQGAVGNGRQATAVVSKRLRVFGSGQCSSRRIADPLIESISAYSVTSCSVGD
jgi:hypothetical protein